MSGSPYLQFRQITKTFPGVRALDEISLDIHRGEIHALLGENGAGKSTLMNILYGLYEADSGQVFLEGRKLQDNTPRKAIDRGVGMIHQHFMLIPVFTVLENLILGRRADRPPFIEFEKRREEVRQVARRFNIQLDLDAPVEKLSVGMQQKVEILKALYKGARLLILDEPTSVLTPQECQDFFHMVLELREAGTTIIFITHKLHEALQISDRITVLRDGRLIDTVQTSNTNPRELSRLMVGRSVRFEIEKTEARPGEEVLTLQKVSLLEDGGKRLLGDISLRIHEGEILGLAGVDGNGQSELAAVIGGMIRPTSGVIRLFGQDVTVKHTRDLIEMGLALIPSDRHKHGLVADFSVAENFILETYYQPPFTRGFSLDKKEIKRYAERLIDEFDVRTPNSKIPVMNLSGGNQQKVILGRELSRDPRFLLVVQPTWGLDVGAIEFVHRQLLNARDNGVAILLISTELEELRSLSDRLAVIHDGRIMGQVDPAATTVETIGLMMAGTEQTTIEEQGGTAITP
ncbi:MAG TPA: ABC transporter ATP-binding protein [Candidatus Sulfomarinibacteraceae bacterium]|nr:ABC transporter ATP-binding protein [Candidatus Sulfomarinibacteraceae bacterium]